MKEKTSLVFTGDIGFDRYMTGRWADPDLLDKKIMDFFQSADHVAANVEGALMSAGEDVAGRGIYFHTMDPATAGLLKGIGADIWVIGNNHIMDAAGEGLTNTKRIAREMNCYTAGAGENIEDASVPVILNEAGGIGILSVAYYPECIPAGSDEPGNFCWDEFELIEKRIREIKKTCRWCILICHGGEEFSAMPMPYIRERYLKYLGMGADVIVAHHPHVPQNFETLPDGKTIFYSLGNFIFNTDYQRAQLYTDRGILLKLTFTEDGYEPEALGIKLDRDTERLYAHELPKIFTDINEKEYRLLLPLAASVLIANEKRRQIYLEPGKFRNCSDNVWKEYFLSDTIDDYVKDQYMDFAVITELSETGRDSWKKSSLSEAVDYMLSML